MPFCRGTRWHFLTGVKKSGSPLVRSVLSQQCLVDDAMLQFLCDMVSPFAAPPCVRCD